jgi:hypothetical protein
MCVCSTPTQRADLQEMANINPTITSVHGGISSTSKLKLGNSSTAAVAKAKGLGLIPRAETKNNTRAATAHMALASRQSSHWEP